MLRALDQCGKVGGSSPKSNETHNAFSSPIVRVFDVTLL